MNTARAALLLSTFPNRAEALALVRTVLEERLIACAHLLEKGHSLYFWEGKIVEQSEVLVLVKTRTALVSKLIQRIRDLHSYECPEILALPLTAGNEAYFDWIEAETHL